MPGARVNNGDDTASRLVLAAEQLVGEVGEAATSLRAVTRAARSNVAAVHYHFGGRDELMRAVLERHVAPLGPRRLALLDEAVARHGDPVPVPALVEALVRPDVELLAKLRRHRVQLARFVGRAYSTVGAAGRSVDRQYEQALDRVGTLLARSVPGVDPAELAVRTRLVVATVRVLFATATDPDEPGPLGRGGVEAQVQRLVAFCAAGLGAAPAKRKKKPAVP